jgi:hypothetical protein
MPDREIADFNVADLEELVAHAFCNETPSDLDEAYSEALNAAIRVDCFLGQLKRGERSLLEVGAVADDVLNLAACCMAASSEPVNADLAFDNVGPAAERVAAWFGEFVCARDHFNKGASSNV